MFAASINILGTASSGLQKAESKLNAAANNIANLSTPGYNPKVYLSGIPAGGVAVDYINQLTRPVDLTTETIAMREAALLYGANGVVIKAAHQLYGTVLNVLDMDNNEYNPDGTPKT